MALLNQALGQSAGNASAEEGFRLKPKSIWIGLVTSISLFLSIFVMLTLGRSEARAQPADAEYKFKAVYLYNFLRFVEWPTQAFPEADTPIIIGVLGEDPFGTLLDQTVQGEVIQGRKVEVLRFSRAEDVKGCHLLFISRSEKAQMASILSRINGVSILTVSEVEGFTEHGGGIYFFVQKGKLLFEINLAAARRADLKISSKLLRLARVINLENTGQGQ